MMGQLGAPPRRAQCSPPLAFLLLALTVPSASSEAPQLAEPAPELEMYEVIVVGGTPSGCMAAVAAAREGRRTMLLEPSANVGGMMAAGLGKTDYGVRPDTIGGVAIEFFRRIAVHYNTSFAYPSPGGCSRADGGGWLFEPHVAEDVLRAMLREANVTLRTDSRVVSVRFAAGDAAAPRLDAVGVLGAGSGGEAVLTRGRVFIDATYEGSLMKLSGVRCTFGRESRATYDEPSAGRLPAAGTSEARGWPAHSGDLTAPFLGGGSPYVDASNSTLIKGVSAAVPVALGEADSLSGSYDWRLTFTNVKENMLPIPEPDNYDPAEYEIVRRLIKRGWNATPAMDPDFLPQLNHKTDWKLLTKFGLGELVGPQNEYPNATWQRQQEIYSEFKQWTLGLFSFFRNDPASPPELKRRLTYGLCKDEYVRSGHWPFQMYIRVALRMVSELVLIEKDVVTSVFKDRSDAIGLGSYTVDIPGPAQRIVVDGMIANEGSLKVGPDAPGCNGSACGGYCDPTLAPYPLPYGIMTPRSSEVGNLLVPVAVSASHVAFNSLRMEPQWMILGHAAGVAAAMVTSLPGVAVSVGDVDVAALRARLHGQGQVLTPPQPQPQPPPPRPTAGVWYAWMKMFRLDSNASTITATEAKSLLKRVTTVPSGSLPPAEVCRVPTGTVLRLTRPANTTADGYFRVELATGQRCSVAAAINTDKMDGGGRWKTDDTNVSGSRRRAGHNGPHPLPSGGLQKQKPHLVYVLSDNLGWGNVGYHRAASSAGPSPEVVTPNIDELVRTGVELDRLYTYKFCSPSRSR